ncbi:MAG: hypothetical protein GF383_15520 [Candidatus Lokiarchaeota archaeon]|nr:hypothetical protein [Candidatus Lokiarchaeota archaeon]MBD3342970.1 hypothetical protein [Candidatus Lokiarchaeota archaeon]
MLASVCGINCEICPRRVLGKCPNKNRGCIPRENKFCEICSCAYEKSIQNCFACDEFPCELTKKGPINFEFCKYLSGKE